MDKIKIDTEALEEAAAALNGLGSEVEDIERKVEHSLLPVIKATGGLSFVLVDLAKLRIRLEKSENRSYKLGRNIRLVADSWNDCEQRLKYEVIYLTGDYEEQIRNIISSNDEKDNFIDVFEKNNPELKEKIDKLLSKLDDDDVREIKFFIYTAEEPYRSIYLYELESYTIDDLSVSGVFRPYYNTVNLDINGEPGNPRGPYTTFFHESGHAIDYNYQDDGSYYSLTYRDEAGNSLQDVLYQDVRADIESTVKSFTSDATAQQHVMEYIMGAGQVSESSLSGKEKQLLNTVQNYYRREFAGAKNEACSDIFGGVTGNIIHGDYGHWDTSYWYKNGQATGSQSKELWAEYYSYGATGNTESMGYLNEHMPRSREFMDKMANSMI